MTTENNTRWRRWMSVGIVALMVSGCSTPPVDNNISHSSRNTLWAQEVSDFAKEVDQDPVYLMGMMKKHALAKGVDGQQDFEWMLFSEDFGNEFQKVCHKISFKTKNMTYAIDSERIDVAFFIAEHVTNEWSNSSLAKFYYGDFNTVKNRTLEDQVRLAIERIEQSYVDHEHTQSEIKYISRGENAPVIAERWLEGYGMTKYSFIKRKINAADIWFPVKSEVVSIE